MRILAELAVGSRANVFLKFDPRDLWVGLYWDRERRALVTSNLYVCLIPMLVLHVSWWREW